MDRCPASPACRMSAPPGCRRRRCRPCRSAPASPPSACNSRSRRNAPSCAPRRSPCPTPSPCRSPPAWRNAPARGPARHRHRPARISASLSRSSAGRPSSPGHSGASGRQRYVVVTYFDDACLLGIRNPFLPTRVPAFHILSASLAAVVLLLAGCSSSASQPAARRRRRRGVHRRSRRKLYDLYVESAQASLDRSHLHNLRQRGH